MYSYQVNATNEYLNTFIWNETLRILNEWIFVWENYTNIRLFVTLYQRMMLIQMNIRIYSYHENDTKWISEYLCIEKINKNECTAVIQKYGVNWLSSIVRQWHSGSFRCDTVQELMLQKWTLNLSRNILKIYLQTIFQTIHFIHFYMGTYINCSCLDDASLSLSFFKMLFGISERFWWV